MATIENYRTKDNMEHDRYGGVASAEESKETPKHDLDSSKMQKLFQQLVTWRDQELRRQAANRFQMALDEDYYDSMQWTEEDAQALLDRGQAPLVFNEIKPTIDWLIGTERRTRIDYKVLARRKEDTDAAEIKTDLIKYLDDTSKTAFQRSRAFADSVKAGLGWLETGIRGDPDDELAYTRYEDWRRVLYDSNGVELDCADWRYVIRWKWLDEDIAKAYFPERANIITACGDKTGMASSEDDDELYYMGAKVTEPGHDYAHVGRYSHYDASAFTFNERPRVKVFEAWYRVPVLKRRFTGGEYEGEVFDAKKPEHMEALKGEYSLFDKLEMEVRCAIFTDGGLLFEGPSPYAHNRFPLVPVWCYRRKRDSAPYGVVRALRDPQDDLNKRSSKALWILSANRIIADEGAVDDWDELREEANRPDAMIIKKANKNIEIDRDVQLAEEHLMLMDRDAQFIRNVGGVTAENLGRQTNANSGKAITARQDQGGVVTTEPFDNLRYAAQLLGEMELANIEQFYTDTKVIRVVGERGFAKYKTINEAQKDGSVLNSITDSMADFVVSEQDYRSSLRQAMFESLFEIIGRLAQMNPQVALNLMDVAFDMADLPNKDALVGRIRKLNGQRDPDSEPTPEEQQAEAAQGELMRKQQELAMQTAEAQLAEILAKRDSLDAASIVKRVEAMYASLQAAQVVASVPGAATIADEIMAGSGFAARAEQQQQQQAEMINDAAAQMDLVPDLDNQMRQANVIGQVGLTRGIETPENDGVTQ